MGKVNIGYSEIIDNVGMILKYFSGKRLVGKEIVDSSSNIVNEYFRFAVCEADKVLLREFIEESCSWLDLQLGSYGGGYDMKTDVITFTLVPTALPEPSRVRSVEVAIRSALTRRVALHWLLLAGYEGLDTIEEDCSYLVARLLTMLEASSRSFAVPTQRPVPPF